jgi:hypothetical protein
MEMTLMRPYLGVDFSHIKDADLLFKIGNILASLANNPYYPRPWPAPAPAFEDVSDAYYSYQTAVQAALSRDTFKITERERAKQALIKLLLDLAPYLELVAKGDADILKSTGFEVKQAATSTPASREPLGPPEKFSAKHGLSGTLVCHASKLAGAKSYELQITEADPTVEGNWRQYSIFTQASHMDVTGLTPGQKVSLRLRGFGNLGAGAWSEIVSIIVI